LDRGGFDIAGVLDGLKDGGLEPEGGKRHEPGVYTGLGMRAGKISGLMKKMVGRKISARMRTR
jgi:hypothetical protein